MYLIEAYYNPIESTAKHLLESILTEVRTKLLDDKLRRLIRSRKVRRKMLEKCGPKAFLWPDAPGYPRYPVMTPKCKYHCGLILAAYLRARSWHKEDIAQEAIKLYKKIGCDKKLNIIIRQTQRKNWAPRKPIIKKRKKVLVRKRRQLRRRIMPGM